MKSRLKGNKKGTEISGKGIVSGSKGFVGVNGGPEAGGRTGAV